MKNKQKTSRKRSWAPVAGVAAVALVAVVAFVVLVGPGVKGMQATGGSGAAAGMSATAASAAATTDADADAGNSESEETAAFEDAATDVSAGEQAEPEPQPTQPESDDLSWRDADFAVDPNRMDWNYDSNGRKVVYLTIDDGPSENTQAVLDILDRYGCKATFFVVGLNPDYYHMIGEAYRRGHTIGLHSLTHDYAYIYSSQQAFFEDLDGIAGIVRDQIGFVPCFIRFPGGSSNSISANYTAGIMSALVDEVQARGFQYYDWNVSSGDGSEHTADELVYFATEEATKYENIVLLVHDSATKQTTVEALPRIIEYYQGLGYTFEAIDRTSIVAHHGTNN